MRIAHAVHAVPKSTEILALLGPSLHLPILKQKQEYHRMSSRIEVQICVRYKAHSSNTYKAKSEWRLLWVT